MEEEDEHKYFKSQTPRFFKIILHETLQSRKLGIPKSFVRECGRSLCLNKVYLKVTSGDIWEVELRKEEDGSMWLHNGWQEFVEFYHITFGHFLVFGYQGNSEFEVLIFDKTTSEIEYPYKCSNNNESYADVGLCLLPVMPKIEESDIKMAVDHNASHLNAPNCMFLNKCSKNTNRSRIGFVEMRTSKRFSPKKSGKKLDAFVRSSSFHSPNPHFRIIMQATHVNDCFVVNLPGKFIMQHIGQKDCYPKLFVTSGRFWTVKCRLRTWRNLPVARIQMGWKPFVKDNNLVVGDVCVFELIDSVKVHFRVNIFRADKEPAPSHPVESKFGECIGKQISWKLLCCEESNVDIQRAAASNRVSKNPSFELIMTESLLKRTTVPIKRGFLKHFEQRAQLVTLEVAGKSWHVKACLYPHIGQGTFSFGWRKFVRENSLQVGDICKFELIEKEDMVLRVSIHKGRM